MAGRTGHSRLNATNSKDHPQAAQARLRGATPAEAQAPAAGQGPYQARWISRERLNELRRAGGVGHNLLLDHFRGILIIEPVGSNLGDGEILTPEAADYELRQVWCLTPPKKVAEARKLLGLEADALTESTQGVA